MRKKYELKVKKSTLPGAGKGLFTLEDIKKGAIVCEYEGEQITWKTAIKRNEIDKGGYVYYISDKVCIDAIDCTDTFGRYANDAAGLTRVKDLRNNSVYYEVKNKVFIKATRNIPAGSEVLVSYGKEYWDIMRQELGIEDKKKKKKKKKKKGRKEKKKDNKKNNGKNKKKKSVKSSDSKKGKSGKKKRSNKKRTNKKN